MRKQIVTEPTTDPSPADLEAAANASDGTANPAFTADQIGEVLTREWGLTGQLRELGSLEDQNFRLVQPDGTSAVARIASTHTDLDNLELQNAAMCQLASVSDRGFVSGVPIPTRDGRLTAQVAGHGVRLLTWVEGVTMSSAGHIGVADLAALGALAARFSRALDGFAHPALQGRQLWDARRCEQVLRESGESLPQRWRALVPVALAAFGALERPEQLPEVIAHGDLTPGNVVCASPDPLDDDALVARPTGVLDLGDVMRTWRVGDVAASVVGALDHPGTPDSLAAALAVLSGYHEVTPLTAAEAAAFWPLVIARAATALVVVHRQVRRNPGNPHADAALRGALLAAERVASVPPALAEAAARDALGLDAAPDSAARVHAFADRVAATVLPPAGVLRPVDLSVDSAALDDGQWLTREVAAAAVGVLPGTVLRWGEATLVGADRPTPVAVPTLRLGVEVLAAAGTAVRSPVDGIIADVGAGAVVVRPDSAALDSPALDPAALDSGLDGPAGDVALRLSGVDVSPTIAPGQRVQAGQQVASVAGTGDPFGPRLGLQLMLADGLPATGSAQYRRVWLALCPDPSFLLGVDAAAPAPIEAASLRAARDGAVASPQHLYYESPVEIVRGWRHYLYDRDGRCYLDMINNIAAVGHSHPRVTEAASRQLRRLNTNSRFLYDSMVRYAQRLAQLAPPGLDRVFLVNSGSEAADLALQLARRVTGRRDVVTLAGAYHGWTGAVIDISTSRNDRPQWRAELPAWVRVAELPDVYRGRHGADADAYRRAVRSLCVTPDGGPAAFICEPLLGNQGGLELPPGYLAGVYDDMRAAGAVCIADEVQVGMGRTGETFWACEHEGATPDILFSAKAAGNGHPVGFVLCRREIAERYDADSVYFSSTGGGPVSCEIGLAVLDVLRDERLPDNARTVGAHVRARLRELMTRHEIIGALHGRGLYQGVDLVRDRDAKTPDRRAALTVSELLRARGVIMQPTGDAGNVLKIKPPLCLDLRDADYFVDELDKVLTDLPR